MHNFYEVNDLLAVKDIQVFRSVTSGYP